VFGLFLFSNVFEEIDEFRDVEIRFDSQVRIYAQGPRMSARADSLDTFAALDLFVDQCVKSVGPGTYESFCFPVVSLRIEKLGILDFSRCH
jgi:hypothetical protein